MMIESTRTLHGRDLLDGGFEKVGSWSLSSTGSLSCDHEAPDMPGVYAFVMQEIVQYVGVASKSLKRRLYFYLRPGSGQRTNVRLNTLICSVLPSCPLIDIYIATPSDLEWNGWPISGAEGLEAGLIKTYHLPWNVRGALTATQSPVEPVRQTRCGIAALPPRTHLEGGKYGPLRQYLTSMNGDNISMSFSQLEQLVGKLPKSAYLHPAWWANHEGNTQAKSWMEARFLAEANPARRSVVFRRFSY